MTKHKSITESLLGKDPTFSWSNPDLEPQQFQPLIPQQELDYRFFRITEISLDKAEGYRLAMANVLSILNDSDAVLAYILNGTPKGVELYIGVVERGERKRAYEAGRLLKGSLEGNFPGVQLSEVKQDDQCFQRLLSSSEHLGLVQGVPSFNEQAQSPEQQDFQGIERLVNSLQGECWQLFVVAEPGRDGELRTLLEQIYDLSTALSVHAKQSIQQSESVGSQKSGTKGTSKGENTGWSRSDNKSNTQGSNSGKSHSKNRGTSESKGSSSGMNSDPSSSGKNENRSTNEGISESTSTGKSNSRTEGLTETRTSGENTGTNESNTFGENQNESLALTRERINKNIEEMQKHLGENLAERFRLGLGKGMFKTAVYLSAPNQRVFQILSQSVRSIFQGNQAETTPLEIVKLPKSTQWLTDLLQLRQLMFQGVHTVKDLLAHSVPFNPTSSTMEAATWLNTRELALYTGLPSRELPGVKIRESVDFALNTAEIKDEALWLGDLVQHGRRLESSPLELPIRDLNKHVFITGVTGSGKTTTCMRLLEKSELPFLVIEPAKTEYRALYARGQDVDYYLPGREDITPFRLNPFELVNPHQNLAGQISILSATLTSVYPMEAAMPQLVEEAIILAYQDYGWDLHSGQNLFHEDPWAEELGGICWPTFSDMISQLKGLIKSKDMGQELEQKYLGSLVARLTNLTLGVKGQMLNTRRSLNFDSLLDGKVVIELEELKNEQDKALFMGLIIARLAECMKERHRENPNFQHLTLVEEAHRLLSHPEPGESDARKLGVEMFANMLAEVRKYGEGLIIADQIPSKLIPDVIKNTHTKIVHRLFAADDRSMIGDAMTLSDEQKDFLPLLQTGETIVYCGGWHGSVRAQIRELTQTNAKPLPEEELKEKGMKQLWLQRHWLYPKLSQTDRVITPELLATLTQQGSLLLNLFVRFLKDHEQHKEITDEKYRMQEMFKRVSDKIISIIEGFDLMELYGFLSQLMRDTIILPKHINDAEMQNETKYYLMAWYTDDIPLKNNDFYDYRRSFLNKIRYL